MKQQFVRSETVRRGFLHARILECHAMVIGAVPSFDLHATEMDDARSEIPAEACFGTGLDTRGSRPTAEIGIRVTRRDAASRIQVEPDLSPAIKRVCQGGHLRYCARARLQTRHPPGSWQRRLAPQTCQGARRAGLAIPATSGRVTGLNPALVRFGPGRAPGARLRTRRVR